MEKKLLDKTITLLSQSDEPIKWKDMKNLPFEDEDIVTVEYSENDNCDFEVYVRRQRLETDEELEARRVKYENYEKIAVKQRYDTFLKLKKEFEP